MNLLEDILRALGVAGQEAESILSDLNVLAQSRGARNLVEQLPKQKLDELNGSIEGVTPAKQIEIIAGVVHNHFGEEARQQAFEQALAEIIEKEFLPNVLAEATKSQRHEIKRLIIGE